MIIGYHASHEQFSPRQLLDYVQMAEDFGFKEILSSDHFHPWSEKNAQSGFAWSWLGAAMQATSLAYGVVNAPGQRYHPAIIAQAAATLTEMFPNRFWMALGSGQAVNENITGTKWPAKETRNKRLKESADIIRKLWAGEMVSQNGLIQIEQAKLYTRPPVIPPIFAAALSEPTAEWAGNWADGLLTASQDIHILEQIINAFRKSGTSGKLYLKVQVSYAHTKEEALEDAWSEWRNNTIGIKSQAEIPTPALFDEAGAHIRPEHIENQLLVSNNPDEYIRALQAYKRLGFEKVFVHNVSRQQESFIQFMGKEVIPYMQG